MAALHSSLGYRVTPWKEKKEKGREGRGKGGKKRGGEQRRGCVW